MASNTSRIRQCRPIRPAIGSLREACLRSALNS